MVIEVDTDLLTKVKSNELVVYGIVKKLCASGVPINGRRYTKLSGGEVTAIIKSRGYSSVKKSLVKLVEAGLLHRITLDGNNRMFWYAVEEQ